MYLPYFSISFVFLKGISVAVDYKYSFRGLERGTEPYQEMRKIVDARVAKKLLALCQTNRGIYVKVRHGRKIAPT
jgi:hypothetical protein